MQDIHNIKDTRNIGIDYIGIDEVKIPISFVSKETYATVATIDAGVSLNKEEKGAHLSRIVEVLNDEIADKEFSIKDLDKLLEKLSNRVEAENILVNIKFPAMINSLSPITNKKTYIDTLINLKAIRKENNTNKEVEVSINGAMCCHSSKSISKYGAHSQRCLLKVTLEGNINNVKVEDIVKSMESSFSAPVSQIVKREDEKYLTETAYENPKFSEDLIRDVLIRLSNEYDDLSIEAESTNFESIHSHNVKAKGRIKR